LLNLEKTVEEVSVSVKEMPSTKVQIQYLVQVLILKSKKKVLLNLIILLHTVHSEGHKEMSYRTLFHSVQESIVHKYQTMEVSYWIHQVELHWKVNCLNNKNISTRLVLEHMTFQKKNLTSDQGLIIKDISLKQTKVPVLLLMTVQDIQKILMTEKVIVLEKEYRI